MTSNIERTEENGTATGKSAYESGFNILNTIIGAGIIALPYAIKEAGFWTGIFLIVLTGVLSYYSLIMLILCGHKMGGLYEFEKVTRKSLGAPGHYALSFALIFNGIGSCITYLIISGDIVTAISTEFISGVAIDRRIVIILISIIFVFPLLFFRDLAPLAKYSQVGVLTVPIAMVIMALRGAIKYTNLMLATTMTNRLPELPVLGANPLPALGIIAFALMCTQTAYGNFLILEDRRLQVWKKASVFACLLAVVIYVCFAVTGYLLFGLNVEPNLLNNFPANDHVINIARFLMFISIIMTYPMQFYPMRESLNSYFPASILVPQEDNISSISEAFRHIYRYKLFYFLSTLWFLITLVTAIFVNDLGFAFKLIGSVAATLLAFIIPALIYLTTVSSVRHFSTPFNPRSTLGGDSTALSPTFPEYNAIPQQHEQVDSGYDLSKSQNGFYTLMAFVNLTFGLIVLVVGTYTSISKYINKQ